MRRYSFNYLLIALAVYDLLFIVCVLPVYAIPALNLKVLVRRLYCMILFKA